MGINNNTVDMKYNQLMIETYGKVAVSNPRTSTLLFNISDVKKMIRENQFENIISIILSGDNGCYGPDVKPSRKSLNRLTSLIKGTGYTIVEQNKQEFIIEK